MSRNACDGLVFEKQSLGKWTERLFHLVGQFHCQNGVDAVILQWRLWVNSVSRQLQQFGKLCAQVLLRLLLHSSRSRLIGYCGRRSLMFTLSQMGRWRLAK